MGFLLEFLTDPQGQFYNLKESEKYSELLTDAGQSVKEGYKIGSRSACLRVQRFCVPILRFQKFSIGLIPELWQKVAISVLESEIFRNFE